MEAKPVRMHQVHGRIVAVKTLTHEEPYGKPVSVQSRYARLCDTNEQPWERRFSVGEDWQPLDCGWLEGGCSRLVLANKPGRRQNLPTKEERDADAARVVELALFAAPPEDPNRTMHSPPRPDPVTAPFAAVRPGDCIDFEPLCLAVLRVRCRAGSAECVLTLFPR